jgi:hypothetical protein
MSSRLAVILFAILGGFLLLAAALPETEEHLIWTEPQIAQLQNLVDAAGHE